MNQMKSMMVSNGVEDTVSSVYDFPLNSSDSSLSHGQAQIYFGWIPALSGMLRFGDHVGIPQTENIHSISWDSATGKGEADYDESSRKILIAISISNADEDIKIQIKNDIDFNRFIDEKNYSTEVRGREILYFFELGGAGNWIQKGRDLIVYGKWWGIPSIYLKNINFKSDKANLISKYEKLDTILNDINNNDKNIVCAGQIFLCRSGFIYFDIKENYKGRSVDNAANQFFYAAKYIFHRHKYHKNESDALLRAYRLSENDLLDASFLDKVNTVEYSRFPMRMHRHINANINLPSVLRDNAIKVKGFLAYLSAYELSLRIRLSDRMGDDEGYSITLLEYLSQSRIAYDNASEAFNLRVEKILSYRFTLITNFIACFAILAAIAQVYQTSLPVEILSNIFTEMSFFAFWGLLDKRQAVAFVWVIILPLMVVSGVAIGSRWVTLTNGVAGFQEKLILWHAKRILKGKM